MNTSYRLVWNESTGSWSVAHELARGRGKGGTRVRPALHPVHAAVLIAALLNPGPVAFADVVINDSNLTGGSASANTATAGQISIGNVTTINNIGSIAIGSATTAGGQNALAIGTNATAAGNLLISTES